MLLLSIWAGGPEIGMLSPFLIEKISTIAKSS